MLSVIDDVVGELAELSKLLQRKNLTTIEAYQFVKGKVNNLRGQHLGESVHCSAEVAKMLSGCKNENMSPILKFVESLCLHMDSRFPGINLMQ